jgi:hypothetical protein
LRKGREIEERLKAGFKGRRETGSSGFPERSKDVLDIFFLCCY